MSDPGTPEYNAALTHFRHERGIDIQEIRDRERWSLRAAKGRLTPTPKGQAADQKEKGRPQRSRK